MWNRFELMMQPSIWDEKYSNMSKQERLLNYERDVMLYAQAQAIRDVSKGNNNSVDTTQYTPTEYSLKQLQSDLAGDALILNDFEYGSPEYIEYETISNAITASINKANYIALNVKGFIWFLIAVAICLGIPTLFITTVVMLKIAIIVALIIIPILYITASVFEKRYIINARKLRQQRLELIYNYNQAHKPEEIVKEKEVLNLQH